MIAREPKRDFGFNFFNGSAGQRQQNKLILITLFSFSGTLHQLIYERFQKGYKQVNYEGKKV